jgi:hypothetical protein
MSEVCNAMCKPYQDRKLGGDRGGSGSVGVHHSPHFGEQRGPKASSQSGLKLNIVVHNVCYIGVTGLRGSFVVILASPCDACLIRSVPREGCIIPLLIRDPCAGRKQGKHG